jgi:hypothetical protein
LAASIAAHRMLDSFPFVLNPWATTAPGCEPGCMATIPSSFAPSVDVIVTGLKIDGHPGAVSDPGTDPAL